MKPWSQLANAPLIDWVIESLSTDPKKWSAARDAVLNAARDATQNATQNAARDAALNAALDADLQTVWGAVENVTRIAIWSDGVGDRLAARYAARNAILVLIVYDDCQQYLDMTYDQLLAIIVDDQY